MSEEKLGLFESAMIFSQWCYCAETEDVPKTVPASEPQTSRDAKPKEERE